MECLQQEIVKLNQIGVELYQLHKVLPASFHFNEALSLLSKTAADRERQEQFTECTSSLSDRSKIEATSFPAKSNHKLPTSLLQPLAVDPSLPLTQPADWDRIYALTILHNIRGCRYLIITIIKTDGFGGAKLQSLYETKAFAFASSVEPRFY